MSEIGKRLAEWRKENALRLSDIKEKTKISTGNFSDYEKGRSIPSSKALISLKYEYGLDPNWILFGETNLHNKKYAKIHQLLDDLDETELIKMEMVIEDAHDRLTSRRVTSSASRDTG